MWKFLVCIVVVTGVQASSEPDWYKLFEGQAESGEALLQGDLIGTTFAGYRSFVYPGIKYGTARRFEKSYPNNDFSYYPLRGDKSGPACVQATSASYRPPSMSEDCLYLDIFAAPVSPNGTLDNSLRPVLFWVHGKFAGGNDVLGGYQRKARNLAQDLNAVVVPVQYRLGVFGFLSTGDSTAPGNWAISDLKLAFMKVYNNITSFGGDPNKIVLAGQGNGAALISAMLLDAEISSKVFGVVSMSGGPLAPWAMTENPREVSTSLARKLSCPTTTSANLVTCLRGKSADDLLRYSTALANEEPQSVLNIWGPVVDGLHILADPKLLMDSANVNYFPGERVMNILENDGVTFIRHHWSDMFGPGLPNIDYIREKFIPDMVSSVIACDQLPNRTIDMISTVFDLGENNDAETLRKNMIEFATSILFTMPMIQEAQYHNRNAPAGFGVQLTNIDSNLDVGKITMGTSGLGMYYGLGVAHLVNGPMDETLGNMTDKDLTWQIQLMFKSVLERGFGLGKTFDVCKGNYLRLGPDTGNKWETVEEPKAIQALFRAWHFLTELSCMEPEELFEHFQETGAPVPDPCKDSGHSFMGQLPFMHPVMAGFPATPVFDQTGAVHTMSWGPMHASADMSSPGQLPPQIMVGTPVMAEPLPAALPPSGPQMSATRV